MKSAVVYYSLDGNTDFTAHEIARNIGADLIRIEPEKSYPSKGVRKFLRGGKSALSGETPKLKPYSFDPDKYDTVIIGSPVWASSPAPPIRSFAAQYADAIKDKRTAAFVCCSGSGAERALDKMCGIFGKEAFDTTLFVIDPKDRPSPEKITMIREFSEGLDVPSDNDGEEE